MGRKVVYEGWLAIVPYMGDGVFICRSRPSGPLIGASEAHRIGEMLDLERFAGKKVKITIEVVESG